MIPSRCDTCITAGGRFDQVATPFLSLDSVEQRSRLRWNAADLAEGDTAAKKRASKTEYTCAGCGQER